MGGAGLLVLAREVQIPLLAMLLIGGCAAKARRALNARSIDAGIGPTGMFPFRLQRPVAIAILASELALGVGLLVTAGRLGVGGPALAVRAATALLFCTAVAALAELRSRRPDVGCGCFGEVSSTPVGWRTITRAALLGAAALASIGLPPVHRPASLGQGGELLAVTAAELALLAVLSPELGELLVRLGRAEPCELRRMPVARTLDTLWSSASWRRYHRYLISTNPTDVWREGCWRFAVFPGIVASRRVEVIFAVYMSGRHAPVRVGVLDIDTPPASPPNRYSSLTVYKKNTIQKNKINIPSNGPG
ncbi:MAG TPA: MauE/DoxX family redox-associated membrane protein [Trebonia sp.]|nr:MauE/DoxX family redox-associated membrane protein [Trebonia sp.]